MWAGDCNYCFPTLCSPQRNWKSPLDLLRNMKRSVMKCALHKVTCKTCTVYHLQQHAAGKKEISPKSEEVLRVIEHGDTFDDSIHQHYTCTQARRMKPPS